MNKVVSKYEPLHHYKWGASCDGWELVNEIDFSVKQECMPIGTSEQLHFHEKSSQFFFILSGIAVIEIDNENYELKEQQGIAIQPLQKHRIMNNGDVNLEFILCSQPAVGNDRVNV